MTIHLQDMDNGEHSDAGRNDSADGMNLADSEDPASLSNNKYIAYSVGLLSVVHIFNYMDRMAISVLMPQIKVDLELTDAQIGLLSGFAFSIFYAVCGIPIGRWSDSGIRRSILALALLGWSLMTLASGFAQNYLQLFAARVGIGVAEAGGLPPAQSMTCDLVRPARRPIAFAVQGAAAVVGIMAGMALAGLLSDRVGWRLTFVLLGAPGLILALIVRMTLVEPRRGRLDGCAGQGPVPAVEAFRSIFGSRTYRRLMVYLVCNGFVQYGLNQWWPSYFSRNFGLGLGEIGVTLGIAMGVGSGSGMLLGGFLAMRFVKSGLRRPLAGSSFLLLLSTVPALASIYTENFATAAIAIGLAGFVWSIPGSVTVTAAYEAVAPGMRSTAGAISIFFTSVLGFGLGPTTVGIASELLGRSLHEESLRYALLTPIAVIPFMAIALMSAARSIPLKQENGSNIAKPGVQP